MSDCVGFKPLQHDQHASCAESLPGTSQEQWLLTADSTLSSTAVYWLNFIRIHLEFIAAICCCHLGIIPMTSRRLSTIAALPLAVGFLKISGVMAVVKFPSENYKNYFTSSDPHHDIYRCVTGKSSGILSHISSGIISGILSGISSGILPGICSGISSGILSGILSGISAGISSDILSGILSGKSSGILSGKHSCTLFGIPSGILSDILSGIPSGILSGIFSGICSGISSGILSGKSSGILSGKHSCTLFGILSGILSDILSGIPSGILSGISSGILSGISSGPESTSHRHGERFGVVVEVRQGTLGGDGRG